MTTMPSETPARDPESPVDRDVVVVGGGASGLAAAVFTARYGLDTLVLDGGKAAITQCAHVENYLGFPGGIAPDRLLDLGRAQVAHEGGSVRDERVTAVARPEGGEDEGRGRFRVETVDGEVLADRVVVAAAYDGDVLAPLAAELDGVTGAETEAEAETDDGDGADEDPFVPVDGGRTDLDGFYVAGWMADGTVHQVGVNAGHGARVGLALCRDDMSERYWPAVGERYVDWVVHEGRYGGDGWSEHVDEWFDREMLGDEGGDEHALDPDLVARAREDLKAEFLGRAITAEERERRDREGQRLLLDALDDEVIREYAAALSDEDS